MKGLEVATISDNSSGDYLHQQLHRLDLDNNDYTDREETRNRHSNDELAQGEGSEALEDMVNSGGAKGIGGLPDHERLPKV